MCLAISVASLHEERRPRSASRLGISDSLVIAMMVTLPLHGSAVECRLSEAEVQHGAYVSGLKHYQGSRESISLN